MDSKVKIHRFRTDGIVTLVKGAAIGGTMMAPGASGGTMAMILGIYDRLISSISSFSEHKRESFAFLLLFTVGAGAGIFLFCRPVLQLIESFPKPTLFFFLGAVAGGIPMIFRKSRQQGFSWRGVFYVGAGLVMVLGISAVPTGQMNVEPGLSFDGLLLLVLAGFIAAVALVLPGISVSYLLLVLGIYDDTVEAISRLYIPFLVPLGAGALMGILLTTRVLDRAMADYPQATYLMILGFMLGSMRKVFPGVPVGLEWIVCLVTLLAGFGCIMALSAYENRKEKNTR